ncbi:4-phosphoerythronate dehydrogenase [Carboxylicivirga sp. M1479]|uniref:4-phosphoerythronate dehydrogenase n=1 Tax=Carboxylicivirga sp. M1479 TaxID=2594476 RepID=UPI001178A424|nr:4-phosphoerythronate dehydrogenase [Carboxylicivirga sp. M1479]TRX72140.1 4-phosphoerythronate dehydrogenase [Carboxylicivirga sp. M1479]
MLKIVADDKIPFLTGALEPKAEVKYMAGGDISNEDLKNADALITRTRTKCNEGSLNGTSVKMIASATIGFDHIDTNWCEQNNIKWTNAPGCNSESVKQYLGAVLALLVSEKKWVLKDRSIAVVGVGNVGSKVSAMAKALGMTVYEIDPPRARQENNMHFVNLTDVVNKADVITFHTPLSKTGEDKTLHLCDDNLLKCMKSDAIVVNSSRGEVIDGQSLKAALTEKQIGGAVIDVWENEPAIDKNLVDLVWIGTPHIAGYSKDGKAKGTQMSVQAISRFFKLGMDDWEASGLPLPEQAQLEINCVGLTEDEVIARAILHTYPLFNDDADLRGDLAKFEYLRGAYPVRREFKAYQIVLENGNESMLKKLIDIGFGKVIKKMSGR